MFLPLPMLLLLLLVAHCRAYVTGQDKKLIQQVDEPTDKPKSNASLPVHHHPVPIAVLLPRDDYQYSALGSYHKLNTLPLSWNEARKVCLEEGAHLAVINSQVEADLLTKTLLKARDQIQSGAFENNEAWLGAHDLYEKLEWVTIFDEPLPSTGYSYWSNVNGGQPNNSDGDDRCVTIRVEDSGYNDRMCDKKLAFFCERPALPFGV